MKKNNDFILRKVVGEHMLIPTGETSQNFNGMISLNETAYFVWEHAEEAGSFQELVELMTDAYEVDTDTAAQDTANILKGMLDHRVLLFTDEAKNW